MSGMQVKIRWSVGSIFRQWTAETTYHGITEVHYQYRPGMVAFESDIYRTGHTHQLEDIAEIEIVPEATK